MTRTALVLLALLLAGCPSGADPGAGSDAPGSGASPSGTSEGSAEPAAVVPAEGSGPVALGGAPMPAYTGPDAVACRTAEDCRVTQPSDWSPAVECCYDYPCRLDYVAISRTRWDELRAWRRANPFDCAAHLQAEGPCAQRPAQCGLSQDPPPAACVEGACVVAWPATGPEVDADAQICTSRADCVAMRASSSTWAHHCCETPPCGEWVAVARSTVAELEMWAESDLPTCGTWGHGQRCPEVGACDDRPPDVTCRAGTCGFVD